jgi:hypothetical protein
MLRSCEILKFIPQLASSLFLIVHLAHITTTIIFFSHSLISDGPCRFNIYLVHFFATNMEHKGHDGDESLELKADEKQVIERLDNRVYQPQQGADVVALSTELPSKMEMNLVQHRLHQIMYITKC